MILLTLLAASLEALRGTRGLLLDPPPAALVTDLGQSEVDMTARIWIDSPRRREAVHALDGAVKAEEAAPTGAGVGLPYPTSQALLRDRNEEPHGDRPRRREAWPITGDEVPRPRSFVRKETRREWGSDHKAEERATRSSMP